MPQVTVGTCVPTVTYLCDATRIVGVCVYYCSTYYKAVREGGGGTREDPGTLTQGAPVFPGSSRL